MGEDRSIERGKVGGEGVSASGTLDQLSEGVERLEWGEAEHIQRAQLRHQRVLRREEGELERAAFGQLGWTGRYLGELRLARRRP